MKSYLIATLRVACIAFAALLLVRCWFGPIVGIISARSTLNIAALLFLTFIASIFWARNTIQVVPSRTSIPDWICCGLLLLASIVPYLPSISAPFLFDDYVHLHSASSGESLLATLHKLLLEHPTGGDGFFRPLGVLVFWLTFKWARLSVSAWHGFGLFIHAANTVLTYFLLKQVSRSQAAALAGAILFAWHGAHVEDVCWTAAEFDLLAVLFVLITLLCAINQRVGIVIPVFTAMLACLSKESAYCLPLLTACLALFYDRENKFRFLKKAAWITLGCISVFAYRLWYLQGIGGYRTAAGSPMVSGWHPLSTLQALFLRLWALLFMPVNWSIGLQFWLQSAIGMMLMAIVFLAVRGRVVGSHVLAAILFTLCSAVTVVPLLLIGSDLSGARILYLPSVGFCLIVVGIGSKLQGSWVVFTSILIFQLAALLHNEFVWTAEATVAQRACQDVAEILKRDPHAHVYTLDLPRTRHGVFFLANGFPECVALAGGQAERVSTGSPAHTGVRDYVFKWNEDQARLRIAK